MDNQKTAGSNSLDMTKFMSNIQAWTLQAPEAINTDFIGAFMKTHDFAWIGMSALATSLILILLYWGNAEAKYPFGQTYMKFAPRWFSGYRWATSARDVMRKAHGAFKDQAYRIIRHDVNLIMLPPSAVDEVAAFPNELASNLHALEFDLASHFTGLGHLRDAHLHARFVHRKITPNLARLAAGIEQEVDRAIEELLDAPADGWREVTIYPILTQLSSRVSARIMLGKDYATDEKWLLIAQKFTENFLGTVMIMRSCPNFMLPILKWALPTSWATTKHIREAQKHLGPEFSRLLALSENTNWKPSDEEEKWGVEWLVHLAEDKERTPESLVHAEILLILASIPTTVFSEINVLLDIISHDGLIDQVREEIEQVAAEEEWSFKSYGKLHKLDSILRESQRLAPPTMIGLRRIMERQHTLADGTVLPKNSYICVPTYIIQNDPDNTPNPQEYDGLRSYRKRLAEHGQVQTTRHQFVTTESTVLGFGHGRTACPGRYLASAALKIIVSKLLMAYDIKLPGGQVTRPPNGIAHEFLSAPVDAKILLRKHSRR
ncbi:cytochrome P450 [Fusarium oxysporum f. sp. albedinis]|nr:cytochrome P450 [Fusarium oxysporum f. sp. albedinis]